MVVELTTDDNQGRFFTVESVDYQRNTASAVDDQGAKMTVDSKSAGKHKNGTVVAISGYDQSGNPVDQHGKSITSRNITHSYSRTDCRVQGETGSKVLVGVSRNTIRWLTRNKMYVAATRGKLDIHLYVENKDDLALIQERSSDRKASIDLVKFVMEHVVKKQQIQQKQSLHVPAPSWNIGSDTGIGIGI